MFGLFKKKLKYDTWNCSIFDEIKELSIDKEEILNDYNTLRDSDVRKIKAMGFNTINVKYGIQDLRRMKYVLERDGILINRSDILSIADREKMNFGYVDNYSGSLSSSNIKDIINLRMFLDKACCDFKYFHKKTYNAPPNADWEVISLSSYEAYSIYDYKREVRLQILHNSKGTSNRIIFAPITNSIVTPIILIQSDRKNKIEDALK